MSLFFFFPRTNLFHPFVFLNGRPIVLVVDAHINVGEDDDNVSDRCEEGFRGGWFGILEIGNFVCMEFGNPAEFGLGGDPSWLGVFL